VEDVNLDTAKILHPLGSLAYDPAKLTPSPENCGPYLKALADKTRWEIIHHLLGGPLTVGEIAGRLKATQYNVSKHVRVLREAGIVATVKRGKHLHCSILPNFRRRMAKNRNQLDLGCCVFRFDKKCC
jgi:DNA-binding transcriptional ArsR family regulator